MILGREPALIAGFVNAVLGLLLAFGVHLEVEQIAAIMAVVNVLLAIIVRNNVTPLASPTLPIGTEVKAAGSGFPAVVVADPTATAGA